MLLRHNTQNSGRCLAASQDTDQSSAGNGSIDRQPADKDKTGVEPDRTNGNVPDASCSSCLWTGTITCVGLSMYFAHIALEESDVNTSNFQRPPSSQRSLASPSSSFLSRLSPSNKSLSSSSRLNKPVFLAISMGWLVAGVYRWYLG